MSSQPQEGIAQSAMIKAIHLVIWKESYMHLLVHSKNAMVIWIQNVI